MLAKKIANKSDDLYAKSKMIYSLQGALHISIFNQDTFSIDNFEWAFSLLESVTEELVKELKELTDFAFENFKKGEN